jgi:hypothetical protein
MKSSTGRRYVGTKYYEKKSNCVMMMMMMMMIKQHLLKYFDCATKMTNNKNM